MFDDEQVLDQFLRAQPGPLKLGEIIAIVGIPSGRVAAALSRMSMNGSVLTSPDGYRSPWPKKPVP